MRRTLDIKYIKDYWNGALDTDLTVGEIFDDRAGGEDIKNSIVKVFRYPPDPSQLQNDLRFGSVLPESSARPRKRSPGHFSQSVRNMLLDVTCPNNREPNLYTSSGRANKRQKTQEFRSLQPFDSDRPVLSREGLEEGFHVSSQSSGRRGSPAHQIDDSQRSPARKRSFSILALKKGDSTQLIVEQEQKPIRTVPPYHFLSIVL